MPRSYRNIKMYENEILALRTKGKTRKEITIFEQKQNWFR
jgi:hypothetical protein